MEAMDELEMIELTSKVNPKIVKVGIRLEAKSENDLISFLQVNTGGCVMCRAFPLSSSNITSTVI